MEKATRAAYAGKGESSESHCVRRTRERLPSNDFIERDASTLTFSLINERVASDKVLTSSSRNELSPHLT
jgi:hypothetical protein